MKIRVTVEDIDKALQNQMSNPIIGALERTTGARWAATTRRDAPDGSIACQLTSYPLAFILPEHAVAQWRLYQKQGHMQPFEFEINLEAPDNPPDSVPIFCGIERRRHERRQRDRRSHPCRLGTISFSQDRRWHERRRVRRRKTNGERPHDIGLKNLLGES